MTEAGAAERGCYTEHGVSGYGVAVKVSRGEPMEDAFIKELCETIMLLIAGKCMELGARCIGHIKSHVRTQAGTIKADTIGISHGVHSSGRVERPVKEIYMAVNSIVQGIKENAVKAATLDGIHEAARQRGLVVEKEKEHSYFDEFDFVASKREYIRKLEEQLGEDPAPKAGE
jgi:hypothetical protein